jgi:hypothetical protein
MREGKGTGMFARIGLAVSKYLLSMAALCLVWTPAMRAQQDEEQKGIDQGNYNIKQSIEFGGRFTNISGNSQTYDTFVNLRQGPRLLGFTTEMNSLNHHGAWFDRLYFSNFGYGGDPNNVSSLRVSKNRWYSFNAMFRRDENFWNYSLQANPLNPTAPYPNGPAGFGGTACTSCVLGFSPHLFSTRRKLGDYNLIALPDSKVRFRLGYSRNTVQGPVLSSIHQGTEQALLEDYKTTVNTYRLGMDIKVLPRTNISYDQLWNYYKGDTGTIDALQSPALAFAFQKFQISTTQPVDLGFSLNAAANQPCNAFLASGFINPSCSAYFSYFNHGRTRTNTPTEQLNVQSNYWQNLDLSARISYSSGDANVFGYNETLFGRESRTNLRNQTTTGPMFGRRVATTADFGATWHITEKLSFLDTFHFSDWHNPAEFDSSVCSFFSPSLTRAPNVFTPAFPVPLTCTPPVAPGALAPVHTTSSGPDISLFNVSHFLKQDEKNNVAEVEYRFSSRLGARLGYRYRSRTIADASFATGTFIFFPDNQNSRTPPAPYNSVTCPVANNVGPVGNPLDPCVLPFASTLDTSETPIHEHAGLFGLWWRPINNFRISYDMELMSADRSFTRISPRQSQEYRVRAKYQPASWLNLNGSVRIWEARDNITDINNLQHDRVYGFSALFQPNDKLGLELGYDYNDVFSQILICFVAAPAPPGTTSCGAPFLQQLSTYTSKSHYGYFDASWTPIKRLTARLGANLTVNSGSALLINPNAVSGSLDSKWLHPYGGLDYHFSKEWTGKAYWDYYGYHEDPTVGAVQDVFAPRNFRGNLFTLSVRYAF